MRVQLKIDWPQIRGILAEACGLTPGILGNLIIGKQGFCCTPADWVPDEDWGMCGVVVEAMRKRSFTFVADHELGGQARADFSKGGSPGTIWGAGKGDVLTKAICLAAFEALRKEKELAGHV